MMTISAIKSAAAASVYFEKDDYYAGDGSGPSAWLGTAAAELGFSTANAGFGQGGEPVDRTSFRQALDGQMPDGTRLGTYKDGEFVHRPGWDMTFSAPKSVSILAEIIGDRRLVEAHDKAVRSTMAMVEDHYATTRLRDDSGEIQHARTGALALATFRHDTNRNQEPQLHTHAVVLNATIGPDGKARSLEPKPIFANQKDIGAYYRVALAAEITRLGYEVAWGKQDRTLFEVKGVPQEVIQANSSRSREVEDALMAKGLDRETATPRQKELIAKGTRQRKQAIDRAALIEHWRNTLGEHRARLEKLAGQTQSTAPEQQARQAKEIRAAQHAITTAIDILSERNAVFAKKQLEREALSLATGSAHPTQVAAAIRQAASKGELLDRTAIVVDRETRSDMAVAGWTTPQALVTERDMLTMARAGQGSVRPMVSAIQAMEFVERAEAAAQRAGLSWTADQTQAALGILTSPDRITAVQGYAGTAKTTTVLATYAEAAKARGFEVIAMAPTAEAANVLGGALGIEGCTVHRHFENMRSRPSDWKEWSWTLLLEGRADKMPTSRQVWIADEASLLGARNMKTLLAEAENRGARVVLVGDDKQLASVEAGRAFGQLQASGVVTTYRLETIVRQTDAHAREAVYAALRRDGQAALAAIQQGKSQILTAADDSDRRMLMADRWQALTPEERRRTVLVDPSREGRDALNLEIRDRLRHEGKIQGREATATTLRPKGLTAAESGLVRSYAAGDVVRFNLNHGGTRKNPRFARNSYHTVQSHDLERNTVLLQGSDGRLRAFAPDSLKADKGQFEVLEAVTRGLQAGDEIRWTRNDRMRGMNNGSQAQVEAIAAHGKSVTVRLASGKRVALDLTKRDDSHWDYAWTKTAHGAQGATADRVIVHAESWRINLTNTRSFYVSLSRARESITLITDNPSALIDAIRDRAGAKQTAMTVEEMRGFGANLQKEAQATLADQPLPQTEKAGETALQSSKKHGATPSPRQPQQKKDLGLDFGLE